MANGWMGSGWMGNGWMGNRWMANELPLTQRKLAGLTRAGRTSWRCGQSGARASSLLGPLCDHDLVGGHRVKACNAKCKVGL